MASGSGHTAIVKRDEPPYKYRLQTDRVNDLTRQRSKSYSTLRNARQLIWADWQEFGIPSMPPDDAVQQFQLTSIDQTFIRMHAFFEMSGRGHKLMMRWQPRPGHSVRQLLGAYHGLPSFCSAIAAISSELPRNAVVVPWEIGHPFGSLVHELFLRPGNFQSYLVTLLGYR